MLESYKWIGLDGRKSLKGVILRAPLCGANNHSIWSILPTVEIVKKTTLFLASLALPITWWRPPASTSPPCCQSPRCQRGFSGCSAFNFNFNFEYFIAAQHTTTQLKKVQNKCISAYLGSSPQNKDENI